MIRRIVLENFMSHARTEIELADGLTVLTGPNNCGKSAIVAALQILATNGRTTHVMRHGTKECRVTVETDDGHTVVWQRKKNVVSYTINGEDVHRLGVTVPDSLHEKLRLDQVSAGTGTSTYDYNIHFGEQKSPVFLLNESGSRAASFFASSSDASRLVEMQLLHRTRVKENKAEAKRLAAEIEKTQSRLKQFSTLDLLVETVAQAEDDQREIALLEDQTRHLRRLVASLRQSEIATRRLQDQQQTLQRLDRATTNPTGLETADRELRILAGTVRRKTTLIDEKDRIQQQIAALRPLVTAPDQHPVERLRTIAVQLRLTVKQKQQVQAVADALADLKSTPALEETQSLQSLVEKLETITRQQTEIERIGQRLQGLCQPPIIEPLEPLRNSIAKLAKTRSAIENYQRLTVAVTRMTVPVEPANTEPLASTLGALQGTMKRVLVASDNAKSAAKELAKCEAEIRFYVLANPRCATCGASIDPDTLMSSVPQLHDHTMGETT